MVSVDMLMSPNHHNNCSIYSLLIDTEWSAIEKSHRFFALRMRSEIECDRLGEFAFWQWIQRMGCNIESNFILHANLLKSINS